MPGPVLILFDDRVARDWMPFALTRPAGELRFGTLTLRERAERVFGIRCIGHWTAEHLMGFQEANAAPILDRAGLPRDQDLLFLSARAVPAWPGEPPKLGPGPTLLAVGGVPCGWYAPAGSERPPTEFLEDPALRAPEDLPLLSVEGVVLERPWHLITGSAEQVAHDVASLFPGARTAVGGPGVHILGDAPLVLGEGVSIDPGVVLDLRDGPVWLDDGVRVTAFTRLCGPAYVGRNSTLLGGSLSAVTIGPVCKVHGEMEQTVVLGYSNKPHDGFLGHAYLGCWVNLGALTTNSNLKNNYGTIRLWTPTGDVDCGEVKLGCLLGDHVKTAIGTLLNTGTVVGAGSNLFGTTLPPKYVPPFSWGSGDAPGEYDLEKFLETAETVMGRRNVALTDGQRCMLQQAWLRGREEA